MLAVLGGAVGATAVGMSLVTDAPREAWILPVCLVAFLLFLACAAFRRAARWNSLLLLLFSLLLGMALKWLLPEGPGIAWSPSAWLAGGVLLAAAISGKSLHWVPRELWLLLWGGSWFYLLGWMVLTSLVIATDWKVLWALLGFVVFTTLAAGWFGGSWGPSPEEPAASRAFDLYLLGVNLAVALRLATYYL